MWGWHVWWRWSLGGVGRTLLFTRGQQEPRASLYAPRSLFLPVANGGARGRRTPARSADYSEMPGLMRRVAGAWMHAPSLYAKAIQDMASTARLPDLEGSQAKL
jgi:hypothetical protein